MPKRVFQIKKNITIEGEKPEETKRTSLIQGPFPAIPTAVYGGMAIIAVLLLLAILFK